ncbi:MAG: DUF4433 domain-containing protein [Bacteroidaceae bacterium]|nr:DUF4433 domain-containing protein [Bacteroidaceae bacterium]
MVLNWIKRILGIVTTPSNENDGDKITLPKSLDKEHSLRELENRKRIAQEGKEKIKLSSISWYKIFIPKHIEKVSNNIFQAYKFSKVSTLKELKEERLKKEAHDLKVLEDSVKVLLIDVESLIKKRNAEDAKRKLSTALEKIVKVKDSSIRQRLLHLQICLDKLLTELKQEELVRLAEERRRRENEAQKQKEAEARAKKEREKKEREERERREAEAKRLADEARRKEDAERQERQRLETLSSELKDDWQAIIDVLNENGIRYLYHFTDRSNIPLIKRYGGLLSWAYCEKHGIRIPKPGGGQLSRQLDVNRNLQDYVRISFTGEHPMKYIAKNDGRITDPVNLIIDIRAACIASALYSNKNATIKREPVNIGSTIDDLKQIHFRSVKASKHFDLDDEERSYFQAEIMIKTFLSKKYIINLDKF